MIEHWTTFLMGSKAKIEHDAPVDATAVLAVPFGTIEVYDAQTSRRITCPLGPDSNSERTRGCLTPRGSLKIRPQSLLDRS
jgi:hypothetical protein